MGRFHDMDIKEMYGQLIKGIIQTQNLNALCRAFFCNMVFYGSQCLKGFSQALSVGLKASEAVEESQTAFINLKPMGVYLPEISEKAYPNFSAIGTVK